MFEIEVGIVAEHQEMFAPHDHPELGPIKGDIPTNQGLNIPWTNRQKIKISTSKETTLEEILDEAAKRLNIYMDPKLFANPQKLASHLNGAWFYLDEDQDVFLLRAPTFMLPVIENGHIIAYKQSIHLTLEQLVAAATENFIEGDPLKPYLRLQLPGSDMPGAGGPGPAEWQLLIEAFRYLDIVMGEAVDKAAEIALGIEGARRVKRKLKNRKNKIAQAEKALSENNPNLASRGIKPHSLFIIINSRPRTSKELAALLGCSIDQAEAILLAYGFEPDNKDVWRVSEDLESRVFHEILMDTERAILQAAEHESEVTLNSREGRSLKEKILIKIEKLYNKK